MLKLYKQETSIWSWKPPRSTKNQHNQKSIKTITYNMHHNFCDRPITTYVASKRNLHPPSREKTYLVSTTEYQKDKLKTSMLKDQKNRAVTQFTNPQEVDRRNHRQNRRLEPSEDLEVGGAEGSSRSSHHHKRPLHLKKILLFFVWPLSTFTDIISYLHISLHLFVLFVCVDSGPHEFSQVGEF